MFVMRFLFSRNWVICFLSSLMVRLMSELEESVKERLKSGGHEPRTLTHKAS